ncbi:hypothetical protein KW841_28680 [Pseudomonas sp. PDM28]|uniref:hypothetical protein n=1 Tax=Pseudomonas sp. PDM28 TaxID=2854770 RepID=UPI001C47F946|nr:hypothetical protein [Pseudomonas sp. PDM28]MBV7556336.1 hypothetical protein [Pseudomonas sp. PDM28]
MTFTSHDQASRQDVPASKEPAQQTKKDYEDIRQECREKLSAYNANEAYVFLRERGFGTEQYPYNFYQRWLDGMLAKRINYAANRQNELMLLAMQERNEELRRKSPR